MNANTSFTIAVVAGDGIGPEVTGSAREILDGRAAAFPNAEKHGAYVGAQALDLIREPWEADVLVIENMFGDRLLSIIDALPVPDASAAP